MKAIYIAIFLLVQLKISGQSTPIYLVDKFSFSADVFVGADKFGFYYFIKNNVLYKVKNGVSLAYKNLPLGQITKVDLQNPLKIVAFYERFNTVVTLDNQLNETLKIDFSQLKTPLVVSKIGIASQNQLWVFDDISRQLYLYNTTNGNLKAVGTPLSENIMYYNTDFNYFEWLDDQNNWYQCSIFGTVEKQYYDINFDKILFTDSAYIIYKKEEKIYVFDKSTKHTILLENSNKSFESLSYKNQILSIFTNQEINNFKITIP